MLVKFNDQNGCTEKEVDDFMKLSFKNKLFFTCKHWPNEKKDGTRLFTSSLNMIL